MELIILGSGGCTVIPRPTCDCRVCTQARQKGLPYTRAGPSAFLRDINLLVDTPAEICQLLNRSRIPRVDRVLLTHLDPDHIEGLRVVEQVALDFRTWTGYPEKQIEIVLPRQLEKPLRSVSSQYGSILDFYEKSDFVRLRLFDERLEIDGIRIEAIPVDRGSQVSFVYVFIRASSRVVYAPCDIKPFPEHRSDVYDADLLIIQPGIFEDGLKHSFTYPPDHISRRTLYTFADTVELSRRLRAHRVLFVHLEEYWNRSYEDYLAMEADDKSLRFAYDGMHVWV
ncbi:MAG: MBL fold metallo-hydrolase [Chloroflexota bacterium]